MKFGLSQLEISLINNYHRRVLSDDELIVYGITWSEHCSYKNSRYFIDKYLKDTIKFNKDSILSTEGNSPIISINDRYITFKIESHNHPSYLIPYEGAASGLGGIIRDIISTGAKPRIALDILKLGTKLHHLNDEIINGISMYGNTVGIPNPIGYRTFTDDYNNIPLVNAGCIGIIDKILFETYCSEEEYEILLYGIKTGYDGVGGAVMASEGFTDGNINNTHSVQISDSFIGRLVIEATKELYDSSYLLTIQDLGAGGLIGAISELSSQYSKSIDLNIDKVILRDVLTPLQILINESQERMLIVYKKTYRDKIFNILSKYLFDYSIIGKFVTGNNTLSVLKDNNKIFKFDVNHLLNGWKEYYYEKIGNTVIENELIEVSTNDIHLDKYINLNYLDLIKSVISDSLVSSNEIYDKQYDKYIGGYTIVSKNYLHRNTSLFMIDDNSVCGYTFITLERYLSKDTFLGIQYQLLILYSNLLSLYIEGKYISNCINLGELNIHQNISDITRGIYEISKQLSLSVVSGNISLNNSFNLIDIPNTVSLLLLGTSKSLHTPIHKLTGSLLVEIGDLKYPLSAPSIVNGYIDLDLNEEFGLVDSKFLLKIKDLFSEFNQSFLRIDPIQIGGLITSLHFLCKNYSIGANIQLRGELLRRLFSESSGRFLAVIDMYSSNKIKQFCSENSIGYECIGYLSDHKYISVNDTIILDL